MKEVEIVCSIGEIRKVSSLRSFEEFESKLRNISRIEVVSQRNEQAYRNKESAARQVPQGIAAPKLPSIPKATGKQNDERRGRGCGRP